MKYNSIKNLFVGLFLIVSTTIFSQNIAINLGGNPGSASAILDLSDATNNTLGLLLPNISIGAFNAAAPVTAPKTGLIVWNTNAAMTGGFGVGFYYWTGSQWNYIYNSGNASNGYILNQTTPQALANFNIGSNGVIGGTLGVTGATTLSSTLAVSGTSVQTGAVQHVGTTALNGATTLGIAGSPGKLIFNDNAAGLLNIVAPAAITTYTLTLPPAVATANGQVLTSTTAGVLSWATPAAAGLTTANNGLSVTGTTAQLGGNLIQATTVTNNGFTLTVAGSAASTVHAINGAVGIGGAPNASTVLDLTNTIATGGTGAAFRWPTNPNPAANIASPVLGDEVYNTTTGCFNFYNGTTWVVVSCPCNSGPATPTITPSCPFALQGTTITYTSSITTGVTFTWNVTSTVGTPTVTGLGTSSITVTWPSAGAGTGTVSLSITNSCGTTAATPVSVPLYANPTMTVTNPVIVLSAGNAYSVPSMAGATYAWTFVTNTTPVSTIVGSGNAITVTAGSTAGTYSLQCVISFGSCSTTVTSGTITVSCPAYTSTMSVTNPVIVGSSGNAFSVPALAGAAYAWSFVTNTNNNSIVGSGNAITITNASTTGSGSFSLQCIITYDGCSWTSLSGTISVNCPAYSGPMTVTNPCAISTSGNAFSVPAYAGATYAWSFTTTLAGCSIVGSGNAITVTTGSTAGTFVLQCVVTFDGCNLGTYSSGSITVSSCSHGTISFAWNGTINYTNGSVQTWTVPACVTSITVTLNGAQGGQGGTGSTYYSVGGLGGKVVGTYNTTGGTVLNIYVGGRGQNQQSSTYGLGGYNGGGYGGYDGGSFIGGGGGGATDIRVGGTALANRIAVAGGGGGGGDNYSTANYDNGGGGGSTTSANGAGYDGTTQGDGYCGLGATTGVGGNSASNCGVNTNGSLGLGGNALATGAESGGGGGGGYYGGGAGCYAGGGSNYTGGLTTVTTNTQGTAAVGNGSVTIQY